MAFQASALADGSSCFNPEPPPLSELLLKPPCETCDETKAELSELRVLESSRTEAQAKHAEGDHERSVSRFLGEMGIQVDETRLGYADDFFRCIDKMVEHAVMPAKNEFRRTRPYKLPDNGLHPLKSIKPDDSPSYPSGHAAYGAVIGLVLAEMVPELRDRIYARIRDFGFSRMVSGVHFRSDVYAGQIAGATLAASLQQSAEFQHDFERAKLGLRQAIGY